VIDVDVPAGLPWYDANFDGLPLTQTHETRRGGLHLLFKAVPGLRCSTGRIASGIDVRASGGWIVWWPRQGLPFEDWPLCEMPDWLVREAMGPTVVRRERVQGPALHGAVGARRDGDDAHTIGRRLYALPSQYRSRLLEVAKPTRRFQGRIANLRWQVQQAPDGKRNDMLFWASCRFAEMIVERKVHPEAAITLLMGEAWTSGLSREEGKARCLATIANGFNTIEQQLDEEAPL
jgi:hypothetical protein